MLSQRFFRSLLALAFLAVSVSSAWGQVTGAIFGQVVSQEGGDPLSGATVVLSGPQGDQTAITDDDGNYELRAVPVGSYRVRFYYGDVTVEQEVTVSVDKTVRVNARMPAVAVETVRVEQPAPAIDVGSSRVGVTLGQDFLRNVPLPLHVGGVIEKAPGAYLDPVGLSLAGATGAENAYMLDGLNVTSVGYGLLGTNLLTPFVHEIEIISGGYNAEYGRALGGVVNIVTKSGGNELAGSAFSLVTPGFLTADPRRVHSWSTSLTSVEHTRHDLNLGLELGGPIVKDRLFFWVGYAPQFGRTRSIRFADRFVDENGDGLPDGSGGVPRLEELHRTNVGGSVTHHQYAGKLTYRPAPEHDLSLGFFGVNGTNEYMRTANADLQAAMTVDRIRRQDLIGRWTSRFFDRRWQVEATGGLHSEGNSADSPFPEARARNGIMWITAPSLASFDPSVADRCGQDPDTQFQRCPLLGYRSGGYGLPYDKSANRWVAAAKSTHLFRAGGWHQLKYGGDYELNLYESSRHLTGPEGGRAFVFLGDDFAISQTLWRPHFDEMNPDPRGTRPEALLGAPFYVDGIRPETRTHNTGLFVQDSYSPLRNVTLNAGVRWETQRLVDYRGQTALSIDDMIAPRVGLVYDPTDEGRAKIYGHYGHFYESIPLNLNDRAFGGEGLAAAFLTDCRVPFSEWGAGDPARGWRSCEGPPALMLFQGGENLVVQRNVKGSYTEEVVLGAQYEILPNLTVGAAYIRRRLGRALEDAVGIVTNPGDVPRSVLDELEADAVAREMAAGEPGATDAAKAEAQAARDLVEALKALPKPRRDYDGLQLTAARRLARNWLLLASYTYSRTRGNYPGLYAADKGQLDPNYTSLYDLPDLLMNREGPLPNDRPHLLRVDGYYQHLFGRSALVAGLGWVARSGQPQNALGTHPLAGPGETFILPRGSMGRTPIVTRLDLHLAYRTRLTDGTTLDAFVDVFNVLNQRTALAVDQNYTFDPVDPIIGGDERDLAHLKNIAGQPVTPNPNYRSATAYQAPIAGRLGLRLSF